VSLEDYRADMERCSRCSYCKWIPLAQVKSWRFAKGCPSIEYNKFQSYSACGRLSTALAMLENRYTYEDSKNLTDIVYKCMLDGLCDVSCKVCRYNVEPVETMREFRFKLVEDGQLLPQHIALIDSLRKEDNLVMKPKAERGDWARGLDVKDLTREKADVVFHVGCNISFDKNLWNLARTAVTILKDAGVDVGIMGKDEVCCGGRAYDMGYKG
jgi:Fe-S oxidoreductase